MFVSLRRTQTWRLHTKLYKFGWHTSANNARMRNSRDLILGKVVYISIIYRISDSWIFFIEWLRFLFWSHDWWKLRIHWLEAYTPYDVTSPRARKMTIEFFCKLWRDRKNILRAGPELKFENYESVQHGLQFSGIKMGAKISFHRDFKVLIHFNLRSYWKVWRSHWGGSFTGNDDVKNGNQQHSATFFDAHFWRGKCMVLKHSLKLIVQGLQYILGSDFW